MGDSKEGKISSWCDTNRISRYKVIKELSNEYPVTWICESLEITRRSYYKWLNRKDTDNDKMNKELVEFIKKLESEHNNIFGLETLVMHINSETKYHVNHKRVRRLMKLHGIKSSIRISKHDRKAERKEMMSSNILKHNFTQKKSNVVWSTDCTELKYGNQNSSKIRLSAIKDLHDHSIIAWTIADTETKSLVTDTIKIAVTESGVDVRGLILHTDQESAYTSLDFNKQLDGYGIRHSMSRPGTPGETHQWRVFGVI
ncbi:IS3 family transposase [Companilactobacillus zhachilii]|uniref:IS3 family transposase n=1 Tax=Companilactobacillus zhachilii TaxID=2304606 RepID=UPI0040348AEE